VSRRSDLERIRAGLARSREILAAFTPGAVPHRSKGPNDPVTAADLAIDAALRECLPLAGDGWLSEETADDRARLARRRVWVVDPLDGTQEFVTGVPEWCVSIALVEDGVAVAGGLCNPAAGRTLLGSLETGVTLDGEPCRVRQGEWLEGAVVLASRSETGRGEWERFRDEPITIRPVGSVAYKLGLVAAGLADATWTLVPKHEWDVAAGAALVEAAGGAVRTLAGAPLRFNRCEPRVAGLIASAPGRIGPIRDLLFGPRGASRPD
jgi:myo-inositol-1(or 4)-monophosphatase